MITADKIDEMAEDCIQKFGPDQCLDVEYAIIKMLDDIYSGSLEPD
jgi:hypothetical protein